MSNNTPVVKISELDFNQIKNNLINFLRTKEEYQSADFSGSGWQYLIDLLAYNTAYNAFYLNMVASEMFLDSAQLRDSVVSRAKMLGYLPASRRSARARIQVKSFVSTSNVPAQIQIPRTSAFVGINTVNTAFTFTITEPKTLYLVNPSGAPSDYNPAGYFQTEIDIIEGKRLTFRYDVTGDINQKFVIPNPNIDTASIFVKVQESSTDLRNFVYTRAEDITELSLTSKVYFLQPADSGLYELYFGDGVISEGLRPGNIMYVEYIVSEGSAANDIKKFTPASKVGVPYPPNKLVTSESITLVSQSTGGEDAESLSSIKYTAPVNFEMQNRAVTRMDFEQIIWRYYPRIDTLIVWGGEDNDPPEYGRVFISIKPSEGYYLDNADKELIIDEIRKRCVVTQEPVIVDPSYLYLIPYSTVKWSYRNSLKKKQEIQYMAYTAIKDYSENQLEKFGRGFAYSDFVEMLDAVEENIYSNLTHVVLKKVINPILGFPEVHTIKFGNKLNGDLLDNAFYGKALYSSTFKFTEDLAECFFAERESKSNLITLFKIDGATNSLQSIGDYGTIDWDTGKIQINKAFTPNDWSSLQHVEFYANPKVNDISSENNTILVIDSSDIHVVVDEKKMFP